MKRISLLIVKVLSVIVANLSLLWCLIEFILYLVKDKDFNWWSIWVFIIAIMIIGSVTLYEDISKKNKAKEKLLKKFEEFNHRPKSRFQAKLNEISNKAKGKL